MRLVIAGVVSGLLACQTARPVSSGRTLRTETRAECVDHCGQLGMKMSAVVIIADMTGCVCEPGPGQPAAEGPAAASSGAVAAMLAAQAAAAQRAQQQNIHAPSPTPTPPAH